MKKIRVKAKEMNKRLETYNIELSKKDAVEIWKDEVREYIVVNNIPAFFAYDEKEIPTLKYVMEHPDILKKITVDMGAIKFVINGADIMRPGITQIEDNISENEPIVIIDQNNSKPLAIGIALLDSEKMQESSSGKVIKNIHYVGDDIWNLK